MDMMWDYNHVVNISLTNADDHLQLIPTTAQQDLLLLHKDCRGCWSRHGATWDPDILSPLGQTMTKKVIDFAYMMHLYEATVEGHYWFVNMCLQAEKEACATNMIIYAVQNARPWFNALVDGYMGLAPALKSNSLDD